MSKITVRQGSGLLCVYHGEPAFDAPTLTTALPIRAGNPAKIRKGRYNVIVHLTVESAYRLRELVYRVVVSQ